MMLSRTTMTTMTTRMWEPTWNSTSGTTLSRTTVTTMTTRREQNKTTDVRIDVELGQKSWKHDNSTRWRQPNSEVGHSVVCIHRRRNRFVSDCSKPREILHGWPLRDAQH